MFKELRELQDNQARKDWLSKMTKTQMINYYNTQLGRDGTSYLKNKTKTEIVMSIMNLYWNTMRDERMEKGLKV